MLCDGGEDAHNDPYGHSVGLARIYREIVINRLLETNQLFSAASACSSVDEILSNCDWLTQGK
jgi:hypothetical protein